jgi:hypothetical protein
MIKSNYQQPWFHSAWLDSISMYGLPLLASFVLFFFSNVIDPKHILQVILLVGLIDFGHIFGQWYRIKYNPCESENAIYKYLIFFIISLFVVAFITSLNFQKELQTCLVYLVIYHFIKQQFGIIKIYSRTDGAKTRFQRISTDWFVYLSMLYPFLYWHKNDLLKSFYWKTFLIEIPYINIISNIALISLIFCFVCYVYYEYLISKNNRAINIPKNLSVLGALIGWNFAFIFPTYSNVILFTVIYTHNIAYIMLIWIIGKRDRALQGYKEPTGIKKVLSWTTTPGFFFYFFMINFIASIVYGVWYWVAHDQVMTKFFLDHIITLLPQIKYQENFGWHIVNALFYTTQGTHYIIDGFLWKKEKDYAWQLRQEKI